MESARCKAFMYAADTGSFTKAAERLNYTPSGVSQLVGALENETGLTLLRRTRKGVTLLILCSTLSEYIPALDGIRPVLEFVGTPFVALIIAVLCAMYFLGKKQGYDGEQLKRRKK